MANKIRKNDEVIVIAGAEKGKIGKVVSIDRDKNRVVIDKVNLVKVHRKPTQKDSTGGIFEKEAPIHISNIALKAKGKEAKSVKVGFKVDEKGKKTRFVKATGKEF